jgi:DNA-binding NarL/FixJ family response regulator
VASITLVIADDHPLVLEGLEHLLTGADGLEIRASCATGEEALSAVRRHHPDILILDLHMPGIDGVAVARTLKNEGHQTRIIILTDALDEREALELLRLNVAGVILKDMPSSLMLQCIQKVARGEVWVERRSFSRALEHLLRREAGAQLVAGKLSERELQIVRLCALGITNAEIAQRLSVTEGTVKSHLHKAYAKLGVRGRAGLTRFVHEHGLVS